MSPSPPFETARPPHFGIATPHPNPDGSLAASDDGRQRRPDVRREVPRPHAKSTRSYSKTVLRLVLRARGRRRRVYPILLEPSTAGAGPTTSDVN